MAKRDIPIESRNEEGGTSTKILVFILLAAVVVGFVKLFSFQNATPVTVSFYNWRYTSSTANVVLLAACLGAVVMALVFLSLSVRRKFRKRAAPAGQTRGGKAREADGKGPETGLSGRERSTTPPQGVDGK